MLNLTENKRIFAFYETQIPPVIRTATPHEIGDVFAALTDPEIKAWGTSINSLLEMMNYSSSRVVRFIRDPENDQLGQAHFARLASHNFQESDAQ